MENQVKITTKSIGGQRSNYYRVFINGKEVSVIRHPATNPHLNDKSLEELAQIECKRIFDGTNRI